jgi:hypothetical protein
MTGIALVVGSAPDSDTLSDDTGVALEFMMGCRRMRWKALRRPHASRRPCR